MMRRRLPWVLSALFLLFPGKALAAASGTSGGNSSDDVAVSLLVCLLLLLILALFLAWRRLNRETEGRYHPWRLMEDLVLRWQELWGEARAEELSQGYQDEMQSDEELGEQQRQCDDDMEEEEEQQQQQKQQQLAGSEEEEEERQVIIHESVDFEPLQEAGMQEDGASRATEGSAEALLSGLHSFSGTATWEDSSKQLHVTAL
ncbi:protein tyrosine phosphatase receptor type C-associated protein [Elgaria multicarinata webbii]|uniref:protein tyrosine phosphatase receptor type C-associated protein n=1 Tax=Elgaria multicarinata webbii TaxID=159646 RepID=UPI002FCD5FEE